MSDLLIFIVGIAIFGITVYGAVVGGGLALTFRQLKENKKVADVLTPDEGAPQPPADDHDFLSVIAPSRAASNRDLQA